LKLEIKRVIETEEENDTKTAGVSIMERLEAGLMEL